MRLKFLLLVLVDQITKTVFTGRDFFVRNYGLPFGWDFGTMPNTIILSGVYLVVGWYVINFKSVSKVGEWGKILFLSGAASNLADRLVFGYVRDFIDLQLGFVFNLADVLIVVGIIFLLLDGRRKKSGLII